MTAIACAEVRVELRGPFSARSWLRGEPARPVVVALDGVSLSLRAGCWLAVGGPNGAGKSTLLRVLAGLVAPRAGTVRVLGSDPARTGAARARVGYVPVDDRSFFHRLSVWENLRFFASLYGVRPDDARARVLALPGLEVLPLLERPFATLSAGQRARVALARGIVHDPRVLLVDEVERSLDAATREALVAYLRGFVSAGRVVVHATHDPDILSAARCLRLDGGRVVEGAA